MGTAIGLGLLLGAVFVVLHKLLWYDGEEN